MVLEEGILGGLDCWEGGVCEVVCWNYWSGCLKKLLRKVFFLDDVFFVWVLDLVDFWENGKFLVLIIMIFLWMLIEVKYKFIKIGLFKEFLFFWLVVWNVNIGFCVLYLLVLFSVF